MSTEKARRSPSALIRYLSERWPGAFDAKAPKPLKIGIRDDIRAVDDDLSDEELSRALRVYARTGTYLATLRAGVKRVDLDGNHSGEVSEAEAATAQAWLRARLAKEEATQLPEPKAEPEPSLKPALNRTPSRPAKLPAERLAGIVVEIKRRRVTKRKP
ncbi:ProQ/FINO family protein [Sinorhizobium fredii]|uniref:Prop expression regulator n=1 Tax=Rhizobium fredii TaxID=380 RepID=A0A2A6LPX8_RHIFR|nr:ProQ/FinO family protein [Sinorhizobium fredii]PDT44159.1 prop expression regulator [Sinorhizobium fredii]